MYSTLSNICGEFNAVNEDAAAEHDYTLSQTFSNMLLEALATYPLVSPASLDAAEALLSAVSFGALQHANDSLS